LLEGKLPASEPFPGIGFQITTEDNLAWTIHHATNDTEQSNNSVSIVRLALNTSDVFTLQPSTQRRNARKLFRRLGFCAQNAVNGQAFRISGFLCSMGQILTADYADATD
jgi:hypothetical protein